MDGHDRLDRFVAAAWRWTAVLLGILALGGVLDALGLLPG